MEMHILERIRNINWYHTIDIGQYGVTPGVYNHDKYLANYEIPDSFRGETVLDVGAGDGYFSYIFEERGANVTALNPLSWKEEDYVPALAQEWSLESTQSTFDALEVSRAARASNISYTRGTIYDLPEIFADPFDVVFCGSVLCHLINPLGALIAIRKVTKKYAIIATPIIRSTDDDTRCLFLGHKFVHTFWAPTLPCLIQMARVAGFTSVEPGSVFDLMSDREPGEGSLHGVVRCYV